MSTPAGRRSNLLLITLLLAISVLLEQFFIAPILPWLGNLGSIRPMIVFLDIPLELPAIDLIPVSIIFALFYQVAPSAGLTREHPSISSGARVWKALTGWWLLLILMIASGTAFYYAVDYLPRTVSNGIDSFGVRADLTLPYPSGGLIHLHGSVVMLAFSALGVLILHRRTATPATTPATTPALETQVTQPLSSSIVSSTGTLISPSINQTFAAQQPQQQTQQRQRQQPQPPAPQPEENPHARYQPATIIPGYEKPLIPASKPAPASVATTIAETITAPAPKAKPAPKPEPVTITETTVATAQTAPSPITSTPSAIASAPAAPPAPSTRSYVQKPTPRTTTIITPEPPPICRLTTPPPIAVVMPRPAPGIGKMHPCYVIGNLKPVKNS